MRGKVSVLVAGGIGLAQVLAVDQARSELRALCLKHGHLFFPLVLLSDQADETTIDQSEDSIWVT